MSTDASVYSTSTITSLLSIICPSFDTDEDNNQFDESRYNTLFNYDKKIVAARKKLEKRRRLRQLGHGIYNIFQKEQDLFDSILNSDKFICHFSVDSIMSEILDFHLNQLSKLHLETKFATYSAKLCENILKNLEIDKIPCIVIFLRGRITHLIDFKTRVLTGTIDTLQLEYRLYELKAIKKRPIDLEDYEEISKEVIVLYKSENMDDSEA